MKHLKYFENNIVDLIPMQMYLDPLDKTYWCYIGKYDDLNVPIIALDIFEDDIKVTFYEKDSGVRSKKLNYDLIKFCIDNNITKKVVDALVINHFTLHKVNELIFEFRERLLANKDIQVSLNANTYNL